MLIQGSVIQIAVEQLATTTLIKDDLGRVYVEPKEIGISIPLYILYILYIINILHSLFINTVIHFVADILTSYLPMLFKKHMLTNPIDF